MKKLSIITVTFNAEQTLERTLSSISSQSYPYIEHIIVDGKSTDNTIDLVHKYENDKLKWISEPDKGLYDAMNKGIKMSTGDYLCFLNAGDTFFAADTVELIMQSDEPADIIYGETAIVDNNGNFLHMRRLKAPDKLTWKSFKEGMLVCHQAFIVRREITEPYDLSYNFSSDFDWSIRMLKKSKAIINTNLILINYLNEGMTTTNRKKSLKERYQIMVKHYGKFSTFLHHLWFVVRFVIK
ncbi:MAG: glycosyltransferase family 2 protein [Fermentimonas sp.]|nr:glycosyltransferase family 2 protein [Fermentimonas sp.]MDD4697583.1 glycosyltransferase family 2 protein [Fermentimonas sp.]